MKKFMKAAALLTAACILWAMMPFAAAQADVVKVRTIGELKNYLHESLLNYPDVIEMEYSESLQPQIESGDVFNELLNDSYGVKNASWNWSWERKGGVFKGKVVISPINYYNGIEIIKAVQRGTTDQLSKEQQDTLDIAQQMAQEARQGAHTLLEVERAVHDAICKRTAYVLDDKESVRDNAIGALLYGEAECDGYSDAFYLVGTLAGLHIGFQEGRVESDTADSAEVAHLWNMIDIGGKWYHVDLTWDDLNDDYGAGIVRYSYLNAGSSLMTTHTWEEACSPYIAEFQTDWDMFYYTGGGDGAYYTSLEDAARYIAVQREKKADQIHVMVKGEWNYEQLHDVMYKVPVYGKWHTWTRSVGGYTVFSVLFD